MKRTIGVLLSWAIVLGWMGCDGFSTEALDDGSRRSGPVQVYLTDAPGDIAEAYVTIERVEFVPSDEGPVVVVSDSSRRLDLLTLQDGVTETLADTTLPTGTYSQIRLIVGNDATIRLEDGATPELKVPSGPQTGIKIVVPDFTVAAEQDTARITLDFSVEDSFVEAGQSGMYLFKPTVHAQSVEAGGEVAEHFEMEGAVSTVNVEDRTLAVDGVAFDVPASVELEDADGNAIGLDDFMEDMFVEVEGTQRADGTIEVREIAVQGDGETTREVEAVLDAVDPEGRTIELLGATFAVSEGAELDDIDQLADLQADDRVEVAYDVVDHARIALKIERDS